MYVVSTGQVTTTKWTEDSRAQREIAGKGKNYWPAWDFEYSLHVPQQDLPAKVTAIRGH